MNSIDVTAIVDRVHNSLVNANRVLLTNSFLSNIFSNITRIDECADVLYHYQTRMMAIIRRNKGEDASFELAEISLIKNQKTTALTNFMSWSDVDDRLMGPHFNVEILNSGEKFEAPLLTPLIWLNIHRVNLPKLIEIDTDEVDEDGQPVLEEFHTDAVLMFSTDTRPEFGRVVSFYIRDNKHFAELKTIPYNKIKHVDVLRCSTVPKSMVDELMIKKLKR